MDLGDVRRFALTSILAIVLLLVWLFFLFLQDAGLFTWAWPEEALEELGLDAWLGIGAAVAGLLLAVLALVVFGVPDTAPGLAKANIRQVQCQACAAVFRMRDPGHRPLTHQCPSCRRIGVYDGKAPPIGEPPRPQRPSGITLLDLTCKRCHHRFDVTDTGKRPLVVDCPKCQAIGELL